MDANYDPLESTTRKIFRPLRRLLCWHRKVVRCYAKEHSDHPLDEDYIREWRCSKCGGGRRYVVHVKPMSIAETERLTAALISDPCPYDYADDLGR